MPLVDMAIANLKPFWVAQAFGGERLADFMALKQQADDMSEAAADYMNFELKFKTDFRYNMERAIDTMLLRARGILKIVLNPFTMKIEFRSIDPQFILMAEQYDDFESADYFVEVQKLTVPQYQRNRNFNQDPDVLGAIRGKTEWLLQQQALQKQLREGITHSTRDDIIILWNYYEKTPSGWVVRTHCPMAWDKLIRKPYQIQTKWNGETLLPFYSMTMEIKDEGWYAPRGVAELNAAFEAYACKLWNDKADAMTFGNKPLFTSENPIENSANLRFLPGELLPGNIKAVQMPPPAFSFTEEINFAREMAEQRARTPDYGIQDAAPAQGGKPRTATENNRIASLQDVGADHNGDIFRNIRLIKIYRHIWALICHREELLRYQGKAGPLTYRVLDDLKELPAQSLHDQYLVVPAGSSGTKTQRLQRAIARYQLFIGKPNIDQDALAKDVIAADDSRLVNKLLMPQNLKAGKESEDEAEEVGIMMLGFPATVLPGEDHVTRIKVLVGFLLKQHATGAPIDPVAVQRIQGHLAAHFDYLKQQQPQVAKQLQAAIMQMEQQPAGQIAPPQTAAIAQ